MKSSMLWGWLSSYGRPEELVSDMGPQLVSKEFEQVFFFLAICSKGLSGPRRGCTSTKINVLFFNAGGVSHYVVTIMCQTKIVDLKVSGGAFITVWV